MKGETTMRDRIRFTLSAMMWATALLAAFVVTAHAQTEGSNNNHALKKGGAVQPAAAMPVSGSGTIGQISRWTGINTLGDSAMTEDKFGRIGIGTITPTSK